VIRDFHVTGVQTCALPIYERLAVAYPHARLKRSRHEGRRLASGADCARDLARERQVRLADLGFDIERDVVRLIDERKDLEAHAVALEHDVRVRAGPVRAGPRESDPSVVAVGGRTRVRYEYR